MKRIDYTLATNLDSSNYVIQTPVYNIHTVEIVDDCITSSMKNIDKYETDYVIGYVYEKNELLQESYKFGKRIFNILKKDYFNNYKLQINFNSGKLKVNVENITKSQKERILKEFKLWTEKYGFMAHSNISQSPNDWNCTSITLDYYNEKSGIEDILDLSMKYVYLYSMYEYIQVYSDLLEHNKMEEAVKKLNYLAHLLNIKYEINANNISQELYGLNFILVPMLLEKINSLSLFFDIELRPFSVAMNGLDEIITITASKKLFDLSWNILAESISLIYTLGDNIYLLNKVFTCPLCKELKEKQGKTDIICSSCRNTPKGKKFMKDRTLKNRQKSIECIYTLANIKENFLTIEIQNEINELKEKIVQHGGITDHFPREKDLKILTEKLSKL